MSSGTQGWVTQRLEVDAAFRPNQIFAVGGLPFQLLEGERAERIVSLVEEKLWTPLGLRSLAPGEPNYRPRYEGGVMQRDGWIMWNAMDINVERKRSVGMQ